MRKMHKDYLEFLNSQGYEVTFPKKNARVLCEIKHGKIIDLIVEEFKTDDIESKQYLYKKYSFDFGNCLSDWDDWSFSDVFIKIFVSYHVPGELRKKILFELSKVEEWREHVAFWIYRNFSNMF